VFIVRCVTQAKAIYYYYYHYYLSCHVVVVVVVVVKVLARRQQQQLARSLQRWQPLSYCQPFRRVMRLSCHHHHHHHRAPLGHCQNCHVRSPLPCRVLRSVFFSVSSGSTRFILCIVALRCVSLDPLKHCVCTIFIVAGLLNSLSYE